MTPKFELSGGPRCPWQTSKHFGRPIKRWVGRLVEKREGNGMEAKTHDYSRPAWGHNVETINVLELGHKVRVAGFGSGVATGDYLILPNGAGTTRYVVVEIEYKRDPSDMWFANLSFAPRMTPNMEFSGRTRSAGTLG